MAINTAEKRRMASGVAFLPLGLGVTPDASQDAAWRHQAGWSYFLEAGPPPPTGGTLDRTVLGLKESLGTPLTPTIGGGWNL